MSKIYLEPEKVPAFLRGGYSGKKFGAIVCTEVSVPSDSGQWGGGSRDVYNFIKLDTGETAPLLRAMQTGWNEPRKETTVKLEPGFAVVMSTIYNGKDLGLTFYIHPDNAAKLLPAPSPELSAHEKLVLQATCSFKSSYGGRDRYDMMAREMGFERANQIPTRDEWNAAKTTLISKGLLNKAGAVTPAGRNSRPPRI